MKTTGLHGEINVRLVFEPGEWMRRDADECWVRLEASWTASDGWTSMPNAWYVLRKKDGTWSKSERSSYISRDDGPLPLDVRAALERELIAVLKYGLGVGDAITGGDIDRHYYPR